MTLDRYTIWARMAPVFVVAVPVVLLLIAFAPQALALELGVGSAILGTGLSALVAQLGRDFGVKREKELWRGWGGPPTTRFLRHRDSSLNAQTKARYHSRLRDLLPSLQWPDPDHEWAHPENADEVYRSAVDFLLARTRDTKAFPLVLQENIAYGFKRNLWGLKVPGIVVAALVIAACAAGLYFGWIVDAWPQRLGIAVAIAVSTALILVWWRWVCTDTVKWAAEGYARRLLETVEVIEVGKSSRKEE